MKILNLDELETAVEKSIVIKGKTHNVAPLSVGAQIEQLKAVEALKAKGEEVSGLEYVEMSLKVLQMSFPTLTRKELEALTPDMIGKLVAFVRADADEAAAGVTGADEKNA